MRVGESSYQKIIFFFSVSERSEVDPNPKGWGRLDDGGVKRKKRRRRCASLSLRSSSTIHAIGVGRRRRRCVSSVK